MTERTIYLTEEEIAALDTVPRFPMFAHIQDATIALRKRTGIRYGTNVKQGRYNIVTTAYSLNKKGKPSGSATVEIIRAGLTAENLVAAINSI